MVLGQNLRFLCETGKHSTEFHLHPLSLSAATNNDMLTDFHMQCQLYKKNTGWETGFMYHPGEQEGFLN